MEFCFQSVSFIMVIGTLPRIVTFYSLPIRIQTVIYMCSVRHYGTKKEAFISVARRQVAPACWMVRDHALSIALPLHVLVSCSVLSASLRTRLSHTWSSFYLQRNPMPKKRNLCWGKYTTRIKK